MVSSSIKCQRKEEKAAAAAAELEMVTDEATAFDVNMDIEAEMFDPVEPLYDDLSDANPDELDDDEGFETGKETSTVPTVEVEPNQVDEKIPTDPKTPPPLLKSRNSSTKSNLQVLIESSRFANISTSTSILLDLLDLFDDGDDTDEDKMRDLKEILRHNKKRRRRLLRKVKQLGNKMS